MNSVLNILHTVQGNTDTNTHRPHTYDHISFKVLQKLFEDSDTEVFKEVTSASHLMAPSYLCSNIKTH